MKVLVSCLPPAVKEPLQPTDIPGLTRIINSTAPAHSEISRQLHLEPHRVKCIAGHRSEIPKKCVNMHHLYVLHAVQKTNTNPSEMNEEGRTIKGAATGKGMRAEGKAEEARPALRVLTTHTYETLKRSKAWWTTKLCKWSHGWHYHHLICSQTLLYLFLLTRQHMPRAELTPFLRQELVTINIVGFSWDQAAALLGSSHATPPHWCPSSCRLLHEQNCSMRCPPKSGCPGSPFPLPSLTACPWCTCRTVLARHKADTPRHCCGFGFFNVSSPICHLEKSRSEEARGMNSRQFGYRRTGQGS